MSKPNYAARLKSSKGRGTAANPKNRYSQYEREIIDDGWGNNPRAESTATELRIDTARSILSRNQSPDIPFDQSINPYRGCEHGCIYCYARPTHAWLDLSPGLDFETILFYKPNAARLLEQAFNQHRYRCVPTTIGANTDPYQPIERQLQLSRQCLLVLERYQHPIMIITKGVLIERDIDILKRLARNNLVSVRISIGTMDKTLARLIEPRAPSSRRRFETLQKLHEAGVPTGLLLGPVIPALNDHEIEALLEAAANAGATDAHYNLLRLPLEIAELFEGWLSRHYPLKHAHVMNQIRETRSGKVNNSDFFERTRGTGPRADLIQARFKAAKKRYGLNQQTELDYSRFGGRQMSLFS